MSYKFIGALFVIIAGLMSCDTQKNHGVLLTNHIGYEPQSEKVVIFQTTSTDQAHTFKVMTMTDQVVYEGLFETGKTIDQWHTGKASKGKFSSFNTEGSYYILTQVNGKKIKSHSFEIKKNLIAQKSLPLILTGLESIHPAEKYENWDSNISFHGDRNDTVDVHGGWYDASGDFSKYLSHLCYTNYMTPQQTPMVVYNLLSSFQLLQDKNIGLTAEYLNKMLQESLWGADFLMRMQDEEGYFYTIVFDTWSKDPTMREICAYETQDGTRTDDYKAAFREGAGISIAALAKLYSHGKNGEYTTNQYLEAAKKGFAHLLQHNAEYCDNGKENIIDDYTALLAATELYIATQENQYLHHAQERARALCHRISSDKQYQGWWRADADRPYFHAAEAGYPIVSLTRFLDIEKDTPLRDQVIDAIQQNIDFELTITHDVFNPFGYPRQYVKAIDETYKKPTFFIPHQNESGYWYQGENARLASLATAFHLSKKYVSQKQSEQMEAYTRNLINWILGLNPYDICMLDGIGYNNPEYLEPHDWNYVGGIANGITAGVDNEKDIAFLPDPQKNDPAQRWRWPEQWIPHAGWFVYAIATQYDEKENH